jgi:hypothetical protein
LFNRWTRNSYDVISGEMYIKGIQLTSHHEIP